MHTLFVDEAGSTGIDLAGTVQPFFVAAAYLVPENRSDDLRALTTALLRRVEVECKTKLSELKSSSLTNSARGRHHIADLLRAMEAGGAIPVLIAIEKRFSLGGRFVDDFLDLGDNPRAGEEFCLDRDTKRAAATAIGASSEGTLLAIQQCLRTPSRVTRRKAVEAVATDLRTRGHSGLAYIVEGALLTESALNPPSDSDLSFPDFSISNTPNPTSLNALLVATDQFAIRHDIPVVQLVHDDTKSMEAALRHAYWLATDRAVYERLSRTPYLEVYPRVERVMPPQFVKSETEPLVQAADLLAGGVAHWLKRGYRGEKLDLSTRQIAEATFTIFMDGHMPGAGAVFSDSLDWVGHTFRQLDEKRVRVPLDGPYNL